jgi:hypothetical protein
VMMRKRKGVNANCSHFLLSNNHGANWENETYYC